MGSLRFLIHMSSGGTKTCQRGQSPCPIAGDLLVETPAPLVLKVDLHMSEGLAAISCCRDYFLSLRIQQVYFVLRRGIDQITRLRVLVFPFPPFAEIP